MLFNSHLLCSHSHATHNTTTKGLVMKGLTSRIHPSPTDSIHDNFKQLCTFLIIFFYIDFVNLAFCKSSLALSAYAKKQSEFIFKGKIFMREVECVKKSITIAMHCNAQPLCNTKMVMIFGYISLIPIYVHSIFNFPVTFYGRAGLCVPQSTNLFK